MRDMVMYCVVFSSGQSRYYEEASYRGRPRICKIPMVSSQNSINAMRS
jgi:hypothetical protein